MSKLTLPIMAGDRAFDLALNAVRFLRESWVSRNYTSITISADTVIATHILRMVDPDCGQHFRLDMDDEPLQKRAPLTKISSYDGFAESQSPGRGRSNLQSRNRLEMTPIPDGELLRLILEGQEFRLVVHTETFPNTGEEKRWLSVMTKGRGRTPFEPLLDAVQELIDGDQDHIWVHSWLSGGGYWKPLHRMEKRPIRTVVLPDNGANRLLEDAEKFLNSYETYRELGVPFRRGYLLHGLPRSGKSASIIAIASELNLGVYVLNLSGDNITDDTVIGAFTELPKPAILVLEDIDAMSGVDIDRSGDGRGYSKGCALSTLLNCLDGSFAGTNRLTFMTTNHPDKLDPALIGAGRVDVRMEFGTIMGEQLRSLWELYYPTEPMLPTHIQGKLSSLGFVVADIQACLQKHINDPEGALVGLQELCTG